MTVEEKIDKFWEWFSENEFRVRQARAAGAPLLKLVHAKLREIAVGLNFEISSSGEPREFIISVGGNRDLFPLVHLIVRRAPAFHFWRILGLKPARGFPRETKYGEIVFNPADMWFMPLKKREDEEFLGLRIGLPFYDAKNVKELRGGVFEVLEAGVGEECLSDFVNHVEVAPLPNDPENEGWGKVVELGKFLMARRPKGVMG